MTAMVCGSNNFRKSTLVPSLQAAGSPGFLKPVLLLEKYQFDQAEHRHQALGKRIAVIPDCSATVLQLF
jgi:hypothetical protein